MMKRIQYIKTMTHLSHQEKQRYEPVDEPTRLSIRTFIDKELWIGEQQ